MISACSLLRRATVRPLQLQRWSDDGRFVVLTLGMKELLAWQLNDRGFCH